jgi:ribonuclease G
LPLRWFRREQPSEQAPDEAAAPEQPEPPDVTEAQEAPPQEAGPLTEAQKRRRRRGSRGGRGRKRKTATTGTTAQVEPTEAKPAAAAQKQPRAKPERKPQRRQPRRRQPTRRTPLPAAKRELLVSVDVTEQRVAVLEDGRVAEVYLERPGRRSIAGNIYKGTVDNVLPGMEAAFVEIGLEKNGFLYVDEIVGPELEGRRHGKRIQDLINRGQELLVQAVKDPMKSKGARLTTEISLPGRFVVYVPQGEGVGVSRRLDEDERIRLRDILKSLNLPKGGIIVRTAAEGASAEDVERDIDFLAKLWKEIQKRAAGAPSPALVYQEAELPLRVVRDLFAGDFERALVEDERTFKRITGYLKKTSPHMAERVSRYREKPPLFEAYGVDAEIRSTLHRRVDLPSGGYLVFDYAEAFTVIDVNTGRFVGSRSRSSTQRLEDTITKNNLEAVTEVVRQLRLRDIGGIIVIDFIDMANPKNRETVEEALKRELERDRTKTYVVEISPLGLVEMTRQNVTDGPREILTKRCPTCDGDGIVVSETSAAVDVERKLRALAAQKPRTKAFKVELNAKVAALLIGPGASRLAEIEAATRRRFFLTAIDDVHLDHFAVLAEGPLGKVAPQAPFVEGAELSVKLLEVGRYDAHASVGTLDGYRVTVGDAAKLVGKKAKVRVERVLDGEAFATLVSAETGDGPGPITAEGMAEKPTRARRSKAKTPAEALAEPEAAELEVEAEVEPEPDGEAVEEVTAPEDEKPAAPRKRTRRGSRGGRRRKKPAAAAVPAEVNGAVEPEAAEAILPKIHAPDRELGAEGAAETVPTSENGPEQAPKKKRTRRGSRGGKRRRKPQQASAEPKGEA